MPDVDWTNPGGSPCCCAPCYNKDNGDLGPYYANSWTEISQAAYTSLFAGGNYTFSTNGSITAESNDWFPAPSTRYASQTWSSANYNLFDFQLFDNGRRGRDDLCSLGFEMRSPYPYPATSIYPFETWSNRDETIGRVAERPIGVSWARHLGVDNAGKRYLSMAESMLSLPYGGGGPLQWGLDVRLEGPNTTPEYVYGGYVKRQGLGFSLTLAIPSLGVAYSQAGNDITYFLSPGSRGRINHSGGGSVYVTFTPLAP